MLLPITQSLPNSKNVNQLSYIILKHVYGYKIWDTSCNGKSNFNTLLSRLLVFALFPLEQRRKVLCAQSDVKNKMKWETNKKFGCLDQDKTSKQLSSIYYITFFSVRPFGLYIPFHDTIFDTKSFQLKVLSFFYRSALTSNR